MSRFFAASEVQKNLPFDAQVMTPNEFEEACELQIPSRDRKDRKISVFWLLQSFVYSVSHRHLCQFSAHSFHVFVPSLVKSSTVFFFR